MPPPLPALPRTRRSSATGAGAGVRSSAPVSTGSDDEECGQRVQRRAVAVVERLDTAGGRAAEVRRRGCGDRGRRGDADRAADLPARVDEPGRDAGVGAIDALQGSRSSPGRTRGPCRRRRARRPGTCPRSSGRRPAAGSGARPTTADISRPAVSVARTPTRPTMSCARFETTTTESAKPLNATPL